MWLTSTGGSPPPSSSLLQDTRPYHDNGFYNVTPATTTDFPLGENSTVQLFTHSRHPNLLPNAPSHQGGASGGGSTPLEDKLTQLVVSDVSGGGGLVHPGGDSVYFYHNLSSSRAHPGAVVEQPLGGALENAFNTVTLDTYYYNDSSWFNVTPTEEEPLEDEYNWGVLSLSLLILATMVGNVLVCLAVCWEKRLQNMTNYFLMSLAIADLLVSMLVMPLGMVVEFFGYFPLNPGVCVMWATFDVLMCTASIWHMCTMSMDRYFTLKYPMKYGRNKTRTMVALKICFVWVISIGICSPVCILGFMDYSNVYNHSSGACVPTIRSFIIYGSLFAFCIPLCIMVVTYVMTIKILCDNQKLMKSIAKQQGDRKGRKERNGAYSTTYLTPNVYVPRFMERASIDTTVSGITINETSLHDTLVSSPKEETLNLATPLVPEPSPDWSKQNRLSVNQIEMEAMTKWEDRNGQAVVGEACQDPWSASGFVDQSRKPEEMEAKKEVKEDGVLNEHPTICQSASSEAMVGNRHRLLGRTNSGFSAALDPGIEGDFPLDNVTMTLASSSTTTTTSTTSGQSGFSATITSDPLNHIPTQTNFVLSSSQPHLPSALESSFSSIRTRSRLTSAPSGGESPPQDANDANGGHTTSGSSQEYRLAENANRNGKNGLKDSQQLSQGSSLSSMLSRTYWDSNATDLNESNEAASGPDLQEKLSMIEQEMDECLREITPKGQVCSGIKEHTEEEDNDIEMKINLEDGLEVSEESDESESDRESYEDPAEQSLYKADSIDEERQNGGGHITLQGIPPVLVSSPPNGSSDDTPNESDSEKSNLITIHLKASGCYLYQIEPSQSGMRPSGEENSSGPNAQDDRKNRSNPLLSIKHGDSTECSCDDLEREHDLELYCQNETEESMSESGNTKMIVHKVHPAKKKKKKLNSRIRGYTSRWHTMMRRKTCRRKSDAPICKVNGMVPPNMISKRTASNEKKASKVLGIIFAVFVVLWTPFFMMNILSVVCEQCIKAITPAMMASIVWLGYMSSLANPIIYTMFNTAFRRAFYRILTCQYPKRNAAQTTQDQILMTNASNWGSDRRNTLTLTLREY